MREVKAMSLRKIIPAVAVLLASGLALIVPGLADRLEADRPQRRRQALVTLSLRFGAAKKLSLRLAFRLRADRSVDSRVRRTTTR